MYTPTPKIFSVSEVNAYAKNLLDNDDNLKHIFVTGEISNYKAHYSGHLYMTIKDETSSVKAVMFAGNAARLKFSVENGMKVLVFGTVSLFSRDGSFQLYINDMQPDGVGVLNVAFEQLKKKLADEGLFDENSKKPLPEFPEKIGVVTSATGAAIQDIFNVLKRRYPVAQVVVRPCQVQGEGAAQDIANAIKEFNRLNGADVLIVGRGGGSIEDLWAFNEETVARAVYESQIPIISAVGHETDFTICDFVADKRAPTPSAAAEIAVPDIFELKGDLSYFKQQISALTKNAISFERTRLLSFEKNSALRDPVLKLNENRQNLLYLSEKLDSAATTHFQGKKLRLSTLAGKLDALSPLKVISRGYALVNTNKSIIASVEQVNIGDNVEITLSNGCLQAQVTKIYSEE